jgi:hypothetical protein
VIDTPFVNIARGRFDHGFAIRHGNVHTQLAQLTMKLSGSDLTLKTKQLTTAEGGPNKSKTDLAGGVVVFKCQTQIRLALNLASLTNQRREFLLKMQLSDC